MYKCLVNIQNKINSHIFQWSTAATPPHAECRSLLFPFLDFHSHYPPVRPQLKKRKEKTRAVADKRRSVFAPLISGNYICWRGGKWSSPGGVLYSTHSVS